MRALLREGKQPRSQTIPLQCGPDRHVDHEQMVGVGHQDDDAVHLTQHPYLMAGDARCIVIVHGQRTHADARREGSECILDQRPYGVQII